MVHAINKDYMVVGAAGCGMVYGTLWRRSLTNSLDAWAQLIDTKQDQDHHHPRAYIVRRLSVIYSERVKMYIAFGFIKVQWSRAQIMLSIDLIISHCASRLGRRMAKERQRESSTPAYKTHLNRFLINFSPTAAMREMTPG